MTVGSTNMALSIHRITRPAVSCLGRRKAEHDGIGFGREMSASVELVSLQGSPPQ